MNMSSHNARHVFAYALLALGLVAGGLWAQEATVPPQSGPAAAPQIEVCFVLDTTGSMTGLIEGAKAKIWSIANQMIAARKTPKLKIALVAYRDRGDEYVTKVLDLSEDLDTVYAQLREFRAVGGGDEPESVNQALQEAVTKISWSADRDVLKIIFLVGDSPPHMDYGDDVKYPETCQLAVQKDLIINTVQCGDNPRTTPIWQELAKRSEGSFVAIGPSGDMQVVSTPLDDKLAELNVALGKTLVPYGRAAQQRLVAAKQAAAEAAAKPATADRLAYNAARGRSVQGNGDLIDDLKDGTVKLETIKNDELPAEMQKMTRAEQEELLKHKSEQRQQVQAEISVLVKQRQAYIDAEFQKRLGEGKGTAFDGQVAQLLRAQARRKGIEYENKTTTQPTTSPTKRSRDD
jgi:hypothetical protein